MANRPHSRTQDVWDAFLAGTPALDIARDLGLANQTVYNLITKGRRKGIIPALIKKDGPRIRLRNAQLKTGNIGDVVWSLSLEQLDWLINECTSLRINTISEYILETLRDAHEEAKSKDKNQ